MTTIKRQFIYLPSVGACVDETKTFYPASMDINNNAIPDYDAGTVFDDVSIEVFKMMSYGDQEFLTAFINNQS